MRIFKTSIEKTAGCARQKGGPDERKAGIALYQDADKPWNEIIRKSQTSSTLIPALVAGIQ
ncbi:hypothetical protein [Rhizobium sp. Root483D2]|uniref:hypothetical protein n=1 Tax=Rhizobium sp. Root483D2 TaxID=1736545 RepID=UPI000714FE25|nr:hypothetical protein [Rhizobium sp. Root483D2]KQY32885.1 hypothetical protein ASD32_24220 [Rhizobium sp. Root483D2]